MNTKPRPSAIEFPEPSSHPLQSKHVAKIAARVRRTADVGVRIATSGGRIASGTAAPIEVRRPGKSCAATSPQWLRQSRQLPLLRRNQARGFEQCRRNDGLKQVAQRVSDVLLPEAREDLIRQCDDAAQTIASDTRVRALGSAPDAKRDSGRASADSWPNITLKPPPYANENYASTLDAICRVSTARCCSGDARRLPGQSSTGYRRRLSTLHRGEIGSWSVAQDVARPFASRNSGFRWRRRRHNRIAGAVVVWTTLTAATRGVGSTGLPDYALFPHLRVKTTSDLACAPSASGASSARARDDRTGRPCGPRQPLSA